jgi:DNA-binding NarL/FixJ family response regulator
MRLDASSGIVRGMSVRCLIVDDNPGFLETASRVLTGGGMTVVGTAGTGAEALAKARETRPDIVLVDIMLASESGFDLAQQLVEELESSVKVVLISTHSAEDFADLVEASPAIGFVPKSRLSASAVNDILSEAS